MEFRDPMTQKKKILIYGLVMTAVIVIGSVLGAGIAVLTAPKTLPGLPQPSFIGTWHSLIERPTDGSRWATCPLSGYENITFYANGTWTSGTYEIHGNTLIFISTWDDQVFHDTYYYVFYENNTKLTLYFQSPDGACNPFVRISSTNNPRGGKTPSIIVNQTAFLNAPRDPFTINSVLLHGNLLTINVTYGGGCEDHDFALIASEFWELTYPPQLGIVLSHDAHHDMCKALITKVLTFDLTRLKEIYGYARHTNTGTIVLMLEGYSVDYNTSIRYSFVKPYSVLVTTDNSVYYPGEDIHINISLFNNGTNNITLSDTLYTVSIYGPNGSVFSFNDGGLFCRAEVIRPGGSFWIGSSTWNQTDTNHQQVPPGEYIIDVTFIHTSYHGETTVIIGN